MTKNDKYVAEAIKVASEIRPLYEKNKKQFFARFDDITDLAMNLQTKSTSTLRALIPIRRTDRFNGKEYTELVARNELDVPESIVLLSNFAWSAICGNTDPKRAGAAIIAARREFARSQFYYLLYCLMTANRDGHYSDELIAKCLGQASRNLSSLNWSDADAIVRVPLIILGADYTDLASTQFDSWLERLEATRDLKRPVRDQLVAALALSWIDEAAFRPDKSLSLLSECAMAMHWNGFLIGWGMHKSVADRRESPLTTQAKRGAAARHAKNRAARTRAVELYRHGKYASKNAAALAISKIIPYEFVTIREWLKGVRAR